MEPFAGAAATVKLARCLGSVETLKSVREMTKLLALPEGATVDGAPAG
jgi:hypothetical protein